MVILPTAKGICGYYEMNTKSEVKRRLRESNNKVDSFSPSRFYIIGHIIAINRENLRWSQRLLKEYPGHSGQASWIPHSSQLTPLQEAPKARQLSRESAWEHTLKNKKKKGKKKKALASLVQWKEHHQPVD